MTADDLRDANRFLMDLHFIQAPAIVAAQLQENKKAIEYMRRIAQVREAIKKELKEKEIAADNEGFYGLPQGSVSTPNAGGKCVTAGETAPTHTLNSTKTVAVATDTYWIPIDADTPRSAKLQLLSIGGVAQYGVLQSDTSFYTHWCPVPKKPN